jgi:hypothetical protein
MVARVDFDRYRNACARARNVVLLPTGGFTKRPGTKYICGSLDQTKVGRLIPFVFSETDTYMLEFSENNMRVFKYQDRVTTADVATTVSNGTFDSNITGWDDVGAGTPSHDSTNNRLTLPAASTDAYSAAEQDITVASGDQAKEHVIRFKVEGTLGAHCHVVVGSSTDSDDIYEETRRGIGWHTIAFTPNAGTIYLGFRNYEDEAVYIDDVAVVDNADMTVPHDYTESQLADLRYIQTADVIYLYHPDKTPRKIARRADRDWAIVDVPWEDGPWDEINPGVDLNEVQIIEDPDFESGINFWAEDSNGGTAASEYDAEGKQLVLYSGDDGGDFGAAEYTVNVSTSGSNVYVIHFRVTGKATTRVTHIELSVGTETGGTDILALTEYEPGWHSVKFTTSSTTFYIRFRKRRTSGTDAPSESGGLTGVYLYRQNANLLEVDGETGSVTCTAVGTHEPFKSTDVGRLIRLKWPGRDAAWGVIAGYTDSQTVTVQLRREAPYADVPTEEWQLGAWSERTGYPSVGGFYQSRTLVANHTTEPQTLYFSQSADLENFRPDSFVSATLQTEDDDGLKYTLAATQIDPIHWIAGQRKLILGTAGGQWIGESQGVTITASDREFTKHADVRAKAADPVSIGDSVVFIEQSGRQVHDLGYQFEPDAFVSADLTILADHLFRQSGCEELRYQRVPYPTVWARRADGRILPLSYNRRQDIVGWAQAILGGSFSSGEPVVESVAVKPGSDDSSQDYASDERDEVWLIVKRTVDGSTVRYIEVMEGYYEGRVREEYDTESAWETAVKSDMVDAFYVDSGITYSGSATTTITGLDHLEGEEVAILADGRVHPRKTVSSGQVTLDYEASTVQVGLPYKWEFETLKLPFGTQSGSGIAKRKTLHACGIVLMDSGKFTVGVASYDRLDGRQVHQTHEIDFLRSGLATDEAVPLFTGEVHVELETTTYRDQRIYIEDESPLPFTCLAIAPQIAAREK